MYGNTDGWHRVAGYGAYVCNGLVTRYYDLSDIDMVMHAVDKPCRLPVFKQRMWVRRKRAQEANAKAR